jgi:hypothetical protein
MREVLPAAAAQNTSAIAAAKRISYVIGGQKRRQEAGVL